MEVSLQAITTHYNPLQFITNQVDNAWKSLQLITIHYNPLQTKSILYHNAWISVQLITIHYNSLRFITNKFMFLSTSLLNHYSSLQSITIHYDSQKMALNPPLNPYLLAPPILETEP